MQPHPSFGCGLAASCLYFKDEDIVIQFNTDIVKSTIRSVSITM